MAHQEKQMHCPVKSITTCIKCYNYLTVAPIFITPNGYICGCCKTDRESIKIRATAYENLAKLLLFPCANQEFGCDKFTQFNNITHDSVCIFNGFKCPTLTECNEIVRLIDIVNHYNGKHKNMIVYQYFQISQRNDIKTCKLLMYNGKAYLLEIRTITTGKCSISLCYVDDQTSYKKYRVQVKSEFFDDSCFLEEQRILKYNPKCFPSEHNTTIVDFNELKEIMIGTNFNFEIQLIEDQLKTTTYQIDNVSDNKRQTETVPQTTKSIKDGFIEELECFVCKEYMTPPIFVCKTGHSLCNECKQRIQQCPLCSANYEGTRNLVLEKLTEHIEYPCRNNVHGCQFIDKLINLNKHEKDCMQIMCPLYNLDNCRHKGSIHTIYQHLQQVHPQQLFNLNQPTTYNMNGMSVSNLHFVQYDGKVFEITINYNWKPNLLWRVRQIDAADDNLKYKFIVDFIDQTNQERILTIGDLCESKQYSNNSITLPDQLLKPFIDDNRLLYFKLDLRKL